MGKNKKNIQMITLAFSIMIVFGFLMNLKGVLIPVIKANFNVSYSSIGLMIFIGDIGYMIATFFGGIIGEKFGIKRLLKFGFILIIISIIYMNLVKTFSLFVLLMFCIAMGAGCFEIGLNSLGAQIFVANAAVMMNLLHFFYGAGSSVSPKFAGWLLANGVTWRRIYTYSLLLICAVFIFLLITSFPENKKTEKNSKLSLIQIVSSKKIWLFTGVLGFCIVAEVGIANWFINFLQVVHGFNADRSSLYLSIFFIVFTVGRMVGGFLAERAGYINILFYFTFTILALFAGGLLTGGIWVILFSFTGFFISIMYPTVMTIIMKEYRTDTTAVIGFIITAAGAVNMIVNWIIGKTSDYFGVYTGFASIWVYDALIIVFLLLLRKELSFIREKKDANQKRI